MGRTIRQPTFNEDGRIPRQAKRFRNKQEMIKYLESLKWVETPESAKGKKVEPKKIEEIHADVQHNSQENKKN